MRVEAAYLNDLALNYAVAKCKGFRLSKDLFLNGVRLKGWFFCENSDPNSWIPLESYRPSTNWAQGGPIIDDENIELEKHWDVRLATIPLDNRTVMACGPTSLIAAMRAYVLASYGDEIVIPDELVS